MQEFKGLARYSQEKIDDYDHTSGETGVVYRTSYRYLEQGP